MSPSASVQSIGAIRDFRAALQQFSEEVRKALVDIELEVRRGREWLLETQPEYWRAELRRAEDAIVQAKAELQRAKMRTLPDGSAPACMDERKALDRAQRRRDHAQEKLRLLRQWAGIEEHEAGEYAARATQLNNRLDSAIPLALRFLERSATHLETYVALGQTPPPIAFTAAAAEPAPAAAAESTPAPGKPSSEPSG